MSTIRIPIANALAVVDDIVLPLFDFTLGLAHLRMTVCCLVQFVCCRDGELKRFWELDQPQCHGQRQDDFSRHRGLGCEIRKSSPQLNVSNVLAVVDDLVCVYHQTESRHYWRLRSTLHTSYICPVAIVKTLLLLLCCAMRGSSLAREPSDAIVPSPDRNPRHTPIFVPAPPKS